MKIQDYDKQLQQFEKDIKKIEQELEMSDYELRIKDLEEEKARNAIALEERKAELQTKRETLANRNSLF